MSAEGSPLSTDVVEENLQAEEAKEVPSSILLDCNTQDAAVKGTSLESWKEQALLPESEMDRGLVGTSVTPEKPDVLSDCGAIEESSATETVSGEQSEEEGRTTQQTEKKSAVSSEAVEDTSCSTTLKENHHLLNCSVDNKSKEVHQDRTVDTGSSEPDLVQPVADLEACVSPTHRKVRVNPFNHLPAQGINIPASAEVALSCHARTEVQAKNGSSEGTVCVEGLQVPLKQVEAVARERIVGRLQDSKSLDGISQVCSTRSRDSKPEGRRATISSALELEGTVSHDGDLTHFVANNLQQKIKMSSRHSLNSDSGVPGRAVERKKADIPPIDPGVLAELEGSAQEVAQRVDQLMKSLNSTIQNVGNEGNIDKQQAEAFLFGVDPQCLVRVGVGEWDFSGLFICLGGGG
uniref:BLOC-1 related complex subunit 6 n=1 Tax=Latimeria chalumnae TaxID=7897 RepID=H3BEF6_LATCH